MLDVGIAACAIEAEAGMAEIGAGDGSGAPAKSAKSVTDAILLATVQLGLLQRLLGVSHLRHLHQREASVRTWGLQRGH